MINKRLFFRKFIENPRRTGSIVQSSPFLVREMIKPIDFDKAKVIVELGAGTGVITKKILKNMSKDSLLFCFEVDNCLCQELENRVKDKRLIVISDGAEKMSQHLKKYGIDKVDYVISGLPLVVLPKEEVTTIINQVIESLNQNGKFIQFQYSLTSQKKFRKMFSEVKTCFTMFNIPPAFIYVCRK